MLKGLREVLEKGTWISWWRMSSSAGWVSEAGGAGPQVTVKKKAGGHRASDRCWRTSMGEDDIAGEEGAAAAARTQEGLQRVQQERSRGRRTAAPTRDCT